MRWRVLVLLVAVAATACGGGGGGDDDDSVSPTTARPNDQVLAERANLQLEDFPPEWKSTPVPQQAIDSTEAESVVFAACMGRRPPQENRVTIAYSPDFNASETRLASSSVAIIKTEEIAVSDFEALRTDRATECLKARIDREFLRQQPGVAFTTTIQRLDLPQFGDDTIGHRIRATTEQGREVVTIIDLVTVRKGRVELNAGFINRSAAFPLDLQRSLLQRMVGRA